MLEGDAEVALFASNRQKFSIQVDCGLLFRRSVVMVEDDCDGFFGVHKEMPVLQPSAC